MSFFKKLFSTKKEKIPSATDSINNLRETENLLHKKQEHLEKQLEDELEIAKKNASTNKRSKF
jgi:charged multivesicular body protein 4